jgi:hypothetical protein
VIRPVRAPLSGGSGPAEDQPDREPDRHRPRAEPVLVPADVLAGIEAVRRSGRTNMLDRLAVARLADRLGFPAAALWVHGEPGLFARGVFHGFRGEPEPERDRPAGATGLAGAGPSAGACPQAGAPGSASPSSPAGATHQTTAPEPAEGEDPRGADAAQPRTET